VPLTDIATAEPTLKVTLGGGVGTGKSTVGDLLASLGAYRIDADQLAREVVEPGSAGLAGIVERFGAAVLLPDGTMDRPAVAAVVFADPQARKDLEAITHPLIIELSRQRIAAAPTGSILVYEVPLITVGRSTTDFDVTVIVEAPLPVRLQRLAGRGMDEAMARARIAAQPADDVLRKLADEIIVNDGTREELADRVAALWRRLQERRAALAARA
jgi:dephospho-CoA kinase